MLTFERASAGTLNHCNLTLTPGLHVILGHEREGTRDIVELAAGACPPRSGVVRVQGRAPHRTPELRRRMVSLRHHEQLFPSKTVLEAVRIALAARGLAIAPEQTLERAHIARWADRPPASLDARECRSVAACIALNVESPLLAALHEPLAYLPGLSAALLSERIANWVEQGALVICTTSSPTSARALGGHVWLLDRGRLLPHTAGASAWPIVPGQQTVLLVRTPAARALAAALSHVEEVAAVAFDETHHTSEVRVQGPDPKRLALALTRAARAHGIPVLAIVPSLPDIEFTRAANAGYLRAAYDAAYRSAQLQPQAERSPHART